MSNIKELIASKLRPVANAIRTKKHTSDLIPIDNYEEEILSIEPIYDTIILTNNGEHDVKDYKKALVEVDVDYYKNLLLKTVDYVYIPSGVTAVPDFLFKNCSKMNVVRIPEGIETIGNSAFSIDGASEGRTLYLPSTITYFASTAFSGKQSSTNSNTRGCFTYIYFAGTYEQWCEKVKNDALFYITSLNPLWFKTGLYQTNTMYMLNENNEYYEVRNVSVPEGITELTRSFFFHDTYYFNKIYLPNSITSIRNLTFREASVREALYFNKTFEQYMNTTIGDDGLPRSSDATRYILDDSGNYIELAGSVRIPSSITSLYSPHLRYIKNLSQVIFPETFKPAAGDLLAHSGTDGKPFSVVLEHTTPPSISTTSFRNIKGTLTFYVPKGTRDLYIAATNWSAYADIIVEPNTITFNVDSAILNNENYQYSTDSGKTFKTFVGNSLILDNVNVLVFKNNDTSNYMNIGTTSGGSEIGSFVNSTLTYNTTENLTLHITLATA